MKKFIYVAYVAALSLSSVVAHAWEYPQNPDRFPSVGFGVQGNAGSGKFRSSGFSQDFDSRAVNPQIDTRLPLSDSFTLSLNAGYTASTTKDHSPSGKSTANFGGFGIHGRYYFK